MQSLPQASVIKDAMLREIVAPIRDALTILGRNKGRIEESALLVSDLIDIGLIRVQGKQIIFNPDAPTAAPLLDSPTLLTQGGYDDELSVSVTGTGATKTITVAVDTGGRFVVRLWLTDTTDPSSPTEAPPTGGDKVDWTIVTEADGTYSESVTNSTVKNWYVNGTIIGKIDSGNLLSFT